MSTTPITSPALMPPADCRAAAGCGSATIGVPAVPDPVGVAVTEPPARRPAPVPPDAVAVGPGAPPLVPPPEAEPPGAAVPPGADALPPVVEPPPPGARVGALLDGVALDRVVLGGGGDAGSAGGAIPGGCPAPNAHPSTLPGGGT